jgi:hypothetical protein
VPRCLGGPSLHMACGEGNVSMKPNLTIFGTHLNCSHHWWTCDAARWV